MSGQNQAHINWCYRHVESQEKVPDHVTFQKSFATGTLGSNEFALMNMQLARL